MLVRLLVLSCAAWLVVVFQVVLDGAQVDVDGLEAAEVFLDVCEVLVGADDTRPTAR